MHIDVLTLFPEMIDPVFNTSILKRAQEKGRLSYELTNFRDYTTDRHKKVDDYPYGGGAGMVLAPQPIFDAVDHIRKTRETSPRIILMCPQGEQYTQEKAEELAEEDHLIFICGHYEGYDERIRKHLVTDEISIGDYILTGGELGAMVIIDSLARLIPGVLGNKKSASEDSFSTGLLEYPQYTRPENFRGMKVPQVLLSGHHENITSWRLEKSLKRTYQRRPDLLAKKQLTDQEKEILQEIKNN